MAEIYVSTDVESDGPIPGPYSMLSFASVAFSEQGEELGAFTRNLETLPDATSHPDTMAFWATRQEAFAACRTEPAPPEEAMLAYVAWLDALPGRPVFVAYPAGYDFLFVYWYLMMFAKWSPFGHSALDIKTYAMALLRRPYRESTKRAMPRAWFGPDRHTHVALDDAREQGILFVNMLRENRGR